ncbi:AAA family ATPase [Micromonospora sp. CPCC 205539]|uniref:nSTAND1 domain-containing NTPase n=1 Tax=Micromonospora sp. CPCC 205539 TaxID=3122408 RepID=UPI002FEFF770
MDEFGRDLEQRSRMQAGVRRVVSKVGGLRGASRGAVLATLCASALAPVVPAVVGSGVVVVAGVGVLGAVGANILTDLIASAVNKLRAKSDIPVTTEAVVAELSERMEALLTAGGPDGAALRKEIAAVLSETGAARVAIEAAVASGDEELQRTLISGLGWLGDELAEVGGLLAQVHETVDELQVSMRVQNAEQRADRELSLRQSVQVRLIREQLRTVETFARVSVGREQADAGDEISAATLGQVPYRGLWPFQQNEGHMFYGRERVCAHLVEVVEQSLSDLSMVVVTGASGAGKSSLLRAGLLPAIGAGQIAVAGSADWPTVVLTPTGNPVRELAVHLAAGAGVDVASVIRELTGDPAAAGAFARQVVLAHAARLPRGAAGQVREHGRLVLVVDQFEDLFTFVADADEHRAFLTALTAIATGPAGGRAPGVVIIGVRGDFVDRCAEHPQLVRVLQRQQFIVGPMAEADLRLTITGPAHACGLEVENGLTDDILADLRTRDAPFGVGTLPLLSQAMLRIWEHREGRRLTRRSFAASGGVTDAVRASAEDSYASLTAVQQDVARELFRQLTTVSRDGQLSRRPIPNNAVGKATDDAALVIEAFIASRLIVRGDHGIDMAHDTLLTAWPRLRTWMEDHLADRVLYSQLLEDATEWDTRGRDPSFLYRGARLNIIATATAAWHRRWVDAPILSDIESDFLAQAHQVAKRTTWIRRAAASTLALLAVGASLAAVVASNATRDANDQRELAVARQLAAQSQLVGDQDPRTSRVMAALGWRLANNAETQAAMAATQTRPGRQILTGHTGRVDSVVYSPDGETIATASIDGTARTWDAVTGRPIFTLTGHSGLVLSVVFSPDGRTIATASVDTTVRTWDARTGRSILTLTGHSAAVSSVVFSPDGRTIATGSQDGTARTWDAATGHPIFTLDGAEDSVVFSPDGQTIATAGTAGKAQIWNTRTGRPIFTLDGDINSIAFSSNGRTIAGGGGTPGVWDARTGRPIFTLVDAMGPAVFSPDGRTIATAGGYGTARTWDATTGRPIATLTGHSGLVDSLVFSPDGRTVATASLDGTARTWDATTGRPSTTLAGHTSRVNVVVFSPDGRTVATASTDGTARTWDVVTGHPVAALTGHAAPVNEVVFSPDGATVATASHDGTARTWDASTGHPIATLTGHTDAVNSVAMSPDAKTIATASHDGTARTWDAATGHPILTLAGHAGPVWEVVFSPDGGTVATANDDGAARTWDATTGHPIATLTGHTGLVISVAMSPDAKTIATASTDGTARTWHAASGRPIATLTGHSKSVSSVVFSPDGRTIATGSRDGSARTWDAITGRPIAILTGHTAEVNKAVFSPDGRTIATASQDGTARTWDAVTGHPTTTLAGHTGALFSVAFSPDGRTIATASQDRTARIWDATSFVMLYSQVCEQNGGPITSADWAHYAGGIDPLPTC